MSPQSAASTRGMAEILLNTRNTIKAAIGNLNPNNASGLDQITARELKELTRETICLVQLFNAIIRLRYSPEIWKTVKVLILAKYGKSPDKPSSHRPISSYIQAVRKATVYRRLLSLIFQSNTILFKLIFLPPLYSLSSSHLHHSFQVLIGFAHFGFHL